MSVAMVMFLAMIIVWPYAIGRGGDPDGPNVRFPNLAT
jgi:hypothetical protein